MVRAMIRYVARRLAGAALVLLVMSLVIYALIGLMPGDPVDLMAASVPNLTPAQIANLRHVYGLDQPLPLRYWHWLLAALGGDLGRLRRLLRLLRRVQPSSNCSSRT
jgi:peptide/nickel transport system permease protein